MRAASSPSRLTALPSLRDLRCVPRTGYHRRYGRSVSDAETDAGGPVIVSIDFICTDGHRHSPVLVGRTMLVREADEQPPFVPPLICWKAKGGCGAVSALSPGEVSELVTRSPSSAPLRHVVLDLSYWRAHAATGGLEGSRDQQEGVSVEQYVDAVLDVANGIGPGEVARGCVRLSKIFEATKILPEDRLARLAYDLCLAVVGLSQQIGREAGVPASLAFSAYRTPGQLPSLRGLPDLSPLRFPDDSSEQT